MRWVIDKEREGSMLGVDGRKRVVSTTAEIEK